MSKYINITQEMIEECCNEFRESIINAKMSDGKLSFTKTFNENDRKATVYFTPTAYSKMMILVSGWDKEIAWHGVAYRDDDESIDNYYITDIMVYPQEVTGSTVNTDQDEYEKWLFSFDDDTFNNIRMQGHSHVNMSTSPSSVDITHQEKILEQLEEDMFYIFFIFNKKFEYSAKIYDMKKNVLFETKDVDVRIGGDEEDLIKFIADAREKVKTKTYTQTKTAVTAKTATASTNSKSSNNDSPKKAVTNKAKSKFNYYDDDDEDDYFESMGYSKKEYSDPYYSDYGYGYGYKRYY